MRRTMLAAVAGVAVAMPLWASSDPAPRAAPPTIAMTPQQIVEARRAAFRMSAADFQLMRTAAEKGADLRSLQGAARSLSQWATVLPTLFPAGTGPDVVTTRARPEIWSNRADFEQRARDYAEAAARMAESAAAGDMTSGAQNWDATLRSCNACHLRYRSELPPSP